MINETLRKNINVDKLNSIPLFNLKEGDNAILKLALFKNSTEFDITGQTVRLGAKTKNGLIEQIDGFTISKNNLDIKLKNSILVPGKVEIDLEIKDSNGSMTTASFFITVNQKVLNDEAVEATNEFDTFTQTVDKIESDYTGLRRIIIDENQAASLQDQINNVNSSLDTIANKGTTVEVLERVTKEEIDRQIADGTIANLTIEDGSITKEKISDNLIKVYKLSHNILDNSKIKKNTQVIIYAPGEEVSTTQSCSDFIPIIEGVKTYIRSKNSFTANYTAGAVYRTTLFYDINKQYLGYKSHYQDTNVFDIPEGTSFIRINIELGQESTSMLCPGNTLPSEFIPYKEYNKLVDIDIDYSNLINVSIKKEDIESSYTKMLIDEKKLLDTILYASNFKECEYLHVNGKRISNNNIERNLINSFSIKPNTNGDTVSKITISDKNLFDNEFEIGTINNNGDLANNLNHKRPVNFINIKPFTTYKFKFLNRNGYFLLHFYDELKNFISYGSVNSLGEITTPSNAYYMKFRYEALNDMKFQLREGKQDFEFEDWNKNIINFVEPITLNKNETDTDEIDLKNELLIKRVDDNGATMQEPKISKLEISKDYLLLFGAYNEMNISIEGVKNKNLPSMYIELPIKVVNEEVSNIKLLSSRTYNNVVNMHYYRDLVANTDAIFTIIEKSDFENNKINVKCRLLGSSCTSTDYTDLKEYANKNNFLLLINSGIFNIDTDGSVDGIYIQDGKILQDTPQKSHTKQYCLGIKADGTMKAYPYNITASEILNDGCINAVVGFVPLIEDSMKVPDSVLSVCPHAFEKHPRQIIGTMQNGDYFTFTCDGRATGQEGMTLNECINFLTNFDILFAFNLDGGGSTQTVVNKKKINRDITTPLRRIPNCIVFE